jgi:hypothetical protein
MSAWPHVAWLVALLSWLVVYSRRCFRGKPDYLPDLFNKSIAAEKAMPFFSLNLPAS